MKKCRITVEDFRIFSDDRGKLVTRTFTVCWRPRCFMA